MIKVNTFFYKTSVLLKTQDAIGINSTLQASLIKIKHNFHKDCIDSANKKYANVATKNNINATNDVPNKTLVKKFNSNTNFFL